MSTQKCFHSGRVVFIHAPETRSASRGNAFCYDGTASGESVWRNLPTTEPFGNTPPETDPNNTGTPFIFNIAHSGYYRDNETQTFYAAQRDCYNPQTGRFCESDPIGLAGGSLSPYVYVNNQPLRYVDPSGRNPVLGAELGAELGTAVFPGPGTVVGGLVGLGLGLWAGNAIDNLINQESKTPNEGEPGSVHVNPGSGQERKYGPDGKPESDIDWDHDHGQGVPHGHNWEDGERGPGLPLSPWPRGRTPNICPTE